MNKGPGPSVEQSKASLVERSLASVLIDIAYAINPAERSRKQQALDTCPAICLLEPVNDLYTRLIDNGDGWEWASFMLRTMDHSRWRTMTVWWLGLLIERSDAEVFSRGPRVERTRDGRRGNHERRMALVEVLLALAGPPRLEGEAIWGTFPKQRPNLPPLGAEIGTAIADCVAVLAYGLRLELDRESAHLILGGSHSPIIDSITNYQWRGFTELIQLAAFSDLITPPSRATVEWNRLIGHVSYWACRGGNFLLAHCLSIDTAYTGRLLVNYVHTRTFRAVGEDSLVAWSRVLPVLPTFEPDFALSRADVVIQLIHGAGEGGHTRFFGVNYDATLERFIAIQDPGNNQAQGLWEAVALRQQCFDAIVEEDLLKGQSIRDRVAAALFHAFYLAIKNGHATTALASARVLLCGPFHSRGPTLATAIRRRAFYCLERSKEIGVPSLTKAVCVLHHRAFLNRDM